MTGLGVYTSVTKGVGLADKATVRLKGENGGIDGNSAERSRDRCRLLSQFARYRLDKRFFVFCYLECTPVQRVSVLYEYRYLSLLLHGEGDRTGINRERRGGRVNDRCFLRIFRIYLS
jgi:hypothetical protein